MSSADRCEGYGLRACGKSHLRAKSSPLSGLVFLPIGPDLRLLTIGPSFAVQLLLNNPDFLGEANEGQQAGASGIHAD